MADGEKTETRRVTKRGVLLYGRPYVVIGRRDVPINSREIATCMKKYEGRVVHVFFQAGAPGDHLHGRIGREVVHLHRVRRVVNQAK